jgi:hypothetical protein
MCTSEPSKAPLRPPAGRYIRRWISTSSTGEYLWITEPSNRPVDIHGEYLSGGLSTEHYSGGMIKRVSTLIIRICLWRSPPLTCDRPPLPRMRHGVISWYVIRIHMTLVIQI